LIAAYKEQGRTLDDLPYTDEFEAIAQAIDLPGMNQAGANRAALFHKLHNIRKSGRLPKLGRAKEAPPRVTDEQAALLGRLVIEAVGRLSLRDQLPYTGRFDELVQRFNAEAGLQFSPHQVWRVIAKLAP
jgi:hypothetical protein